MSDERQSKRVSRIIILVVAVIGLSLLVKVFIPSHTDVVTKSASGGDNKELTVSQVLKRLEKATDPTTCREVLQTIDVGLEGTEQRNSPAQPQVQTVAGLLNLTEKEVGSIVQKNYKSLDAEYLTSCFLIRDGVRSLELRNDSKIEQAELAFAWICRQIYISDKGGSPAPAWWLLQAGSGSGMDRAYVFLEVLRQLNIDGCLIGPPELGDAPSFVPPTGETTSKPRFAPVRAVGVRVATEIYLFDPWLGKPIRSNKGGTLATFFPIRTDPSKVSDWLTLRDLKADEVKRWEIYLAMPDEALAPRMEWLEQQLESTNPVKLYVDALKLRERFTKEAMSRDSQKGVNCQFWNPGGDMYSPGRVLEGFFEEVRMSDGSTISPRKMLFSRIHFPHEFLPKLRVKGDALQGDPERILALIFQSEFNNLFFTYGSPRDNLLRGNYSTAIASLTELKERNDSLRDRIARETNLESAIEAWADQANVVFANSQRAKNSGDADAQARSRADELNFLKSALTEKISFLVRKDTSRVLSAEASYQLALVIHEKAERAQTLQEHVPSANGKAEAKRMWSNAADLWQQYVDNYPELKNYYRDRNIHSRELLARCKEHLQDASPRNK